MTGDVVAEAPLVDVLDGCDSTKVLGQIHGGQELRVRAREGHGCLEVLGEASPSGGARHGADGEEATAGDQGRTFLRSDGTVRTLRRPLAQGGPRCPPPLSLSRYGKNCIAPYEPQLMAFYMYQAQGDGEAPREPGTLGNLPAVTARLHSHVVVSCPRGDNVTRIQRYRVTMLTTWEAFEDGGGHFAPGEAVHEATRCSKPTNAGSSRARGHAVEIWQAYGSIPGCTKAPIEELSGYRDRLLVSLPGRCPPLGDDPGREAESLRAGGRCDAPTGARNCTWSAEPDGALLLDEVAGVEDGASICESGRREFIPGLGRGNGVTFWDDEHDPERCAQRTDALAKMFADRFPTEPGLVDPLCLRVKDTWLDSS